MSEMNQPIIVKLQKKLYASFVGLGPWVINILPIVDQFHHLLEYLKRKKREK